MISDVSSALLGNILSIVSYHEGYSLLGHCCIPQFHCILKSLKITGTGMLITILIHDKTATTLGILSCDIVCFKQIPVHITGLLLFDLHTNDKPELPYILQVTAYYCNIKKTDIVIKYDLVSNEFYYSGYVSNHGLSENHFYNLHSYI